MATTFCYDIFKGLPDRETDRLAYDRQESEGSLKSYMKS